MSEAYKAQREWDREQEIWEEKIKLSPDLYNEYKRLGKKLTKLTKSYNKKQSSIDKKATLLRKLIIEYNPEIVKKDI